MPEWWPVLLGWPAILAALVLSAAGIVRRKPVWLAIAALLALPVFLYLAANPFPGWPALLVPLALAGAGFAVRRQHIAAAWLLLGPLVGISGWLAIAVMSQ
jgi:hypothetical protein